MQRTPPEFTEFIENLNASGTSQVQDSLAVIERVGRTTFATTARIIGIYAAATTEEVSTCLKLAQLFQIKIYPVSSGRNWGFGSSVPPIGPCLILDLSQLKRIREFDERMGVISIEAGVTQSQLLDHLKSRGGKWWMDFTAASPASSVVGNTMERGHGLGPHSDHVETCAGLEVVLANGEILKTGFSSFQNSRVGGLDRWGPGPNVDGLFSQSNLGVITALSVWLYPAPESCKLILFSSQTDEAFSDCIDRLLPLRISGTLKCGPQFQNRYFTLSRVMQYPWDLTEGKTPLSPQDAKSIADAKGISLWSGHASLYGTAKEVDAALQAVEVALNGAPVSWRAVEASDFAQPSTVRERDLARLIEQVSGGRGGTGLGRGYWRMRFTRPEDPEKINLDEDGCGIIATPFTGPTIGADAVRLNSVATEIILRHGFEPNISLWGNRPRILQFQIFTAFDRTIEGEDARVMDCHHELLKSLMALGYVPHRLGILAMREMLKAQPEYISFLQRLKIAADPNLILAPGRYIP